jgi:hypothetical protein
VEIGSGTVNFATVIGVRVDGDKIRTMPVDNESWSVDRGMENSKGSHEDIARGIANEALSKWDRGDRIEVAGCAAETLHPHLAKHLADVRVMDAKVRFKNPHEPHPPACAYSNALGMYEIARKLYG